jgi:hypothetical protein
LIELTVIFKVNGIEMTHIRAMIIMVLNSVLTKMHINYVVKLKYSNYIFCCHPLKGTHWLALHHWESIIHYLTPLQTGLTKSVETRQNFW